MSNGGNISTSGREIIGGGLGSSRWSRSMYYAVLLLRYLHLGKKTFDTSYAVVKLLAEYPCNILTCTVTETLLLGLFIPILLLTPYRCIFWKSEHNHWPCGCQAYRQATIKKLHNSSIRAVYWLIKKRKAKPCLIRFGESLKALTKRCTRKALTGNHHTRQMPTLWFQYQTGLNSNG